MTMTDTPAAATVIALDNLPTPALLALADRYKDPSELELVLTERLRSACEISNECGVFSRCYAINIRA